MIRIFLSFYLEQ